MVSTDASLTGAPGLAVSAALESPPVQLFSRVPLKGGMKADVPFGLSHLPATVRTTLVITLHLPSGQNVIKRRRFERIPPPLTPGTSAVPTPEDI